MANSRTISVVPVTGMPEFISCLELRFKTYTTLGYISHDRGVDLDRFDWSAYHFMAHDESGRVAGTVRLIVPVSGKPQGSDEKQEKPTFPAIIGLEESRRRALEQHELALKILEPLDKKADSLRELSAYIVERHF